MPYNTRRKSLSLPSLGIHVPVTLAERAAAAQHRASVAAAAAAARETSPASMASPTPSREQATHPSKKLKRAHTHDDDDDDEPSRSGPQAKRRDDSMKYTPPPSPPAHRSSIESDDEEPSSREIDLDSINDDIVEAVVVQLQETGNRPHLVKELTAVLMQSLKVVQQSANPCAIISSRLSTYLKRPCWSASKPCPLAKELETVHPRRTYFYLTTSRHQPLPDSSNPITLSQLAQPRAIISPSLSSAASASEDTDLERRRELSPSPEVDLSSPEFDDMDDDIPMPSTPIGSLSLRGFGHHRGASRLSHGGSATRANRASSPPLEKDEKEFTQTADGLQKRKLSGNLLPTTTSPEQVTTLMEIEYGAKDDSGLFGDRSLLSAASINGMFMTSPAIRPSTVTFNLGKKDGESETWVKLDNMLEWDRSPENIELDELDGLLSGF